MDFQVRNGNNSFATPLVLEYTGAATFSSSVTSNANEGFIIAPSSGASYMNYKIGATSYSLIGIAGASNDIITGSGLGDLNIRATNSQKILFSNNNGASASITITSGGNLMINTTTDLVAGNRRLQVQGACAISAKSTGTGGETVLEAWQATTSGDNVFCTFYTETSLTYRGSIDYNRGSNVVRYNTTSDINLKNIIGDSDKQKSIDILNSTKIREYSWKDDKSNKPQIGVIAQELYETYKGAVSKGSDDELFGTEDYKTWGVDKTAFTFHLIAGWQKHEQIINDLQAQIEELKAMILAK